MRHCHQESVSPREIERVVLLEPRPPGIHIFNRFGLPRLGVVLLGTILRDQGYRVTVMVEDQHPFDWKTIFAADLVGVSCISSTAAWGYELADRVRARGIPVVMGGPHPTHCADEALEHADFVVRGEGEVALPALLQALRRGQGFDQVAGLSYHDGAHLCHVPAAKLARDLDQWPDPDLSLVNGYQSVTFLRTRRVVPIQTSRGCPHDCSFCTVTPTFGRKMRYRSVERVVGEMAKYDLRRTHFFFYDDNFAASPRRVRSLLEGFASLPCRPVWSAQVRADVARDERLLDEMAAAGANVFYIGLESVNEQTLVTTNKRQTLGEVSEHLRRIRQRCIGVHGMFVLGFDTDGPGTMERTVAFAQQQRLSSVQFLILTPLPGSRLAQELSDAGRLLHHDWSLYDAHHVCFRPAQITPLELQRWQLEGHRRFYSLRQQIGRALHGRWQSALLSLYAARLNREWMRRHGSYLSFLERHGEGAVWSPAAVTDSL